MLRFFRNIRQKLLENGNVRKYIWYALGEILLVVIGILIALQINNWNEERKNHNLVSHMLSELHEDLKNDLSLVYAGIRPRLNIKVESVETFNTLMEQNQVPDEEQFIELLRGISRGFSFTPTFGTYNTFKEEGLSFLENDSLRRQVVNFYESHLPRTVHWVHGEDDYIKEEVERFRSDFLHYKPVPGDYYYTNIRLQNRVSVENYFTHQSFYSILKLESEDAFSKRFRIEGITREYYQLLEMIETELKARSIQFETFDSAQVIPDF